MRCQLSTLFQTSPVEASRLSHQLCHLLCIVHSNSGCWNLQYWFFLFIYATIPVGAIHVRESKSLCVHHRSERNRIRHLSHREWKSAFHQLLLPVLGLPIVCYLFLKRRKSLCKGNVIYVIDKIKVVKYNLFHDFYINLHYLWKQMVKYSFSRF